MRADERGSPESQRRVACKSKEYEPRWKKSIQQGFCGKPDFWTHRASKGRPKADSNGLRNQSLCYNASHNGEHAWPERPPTSIASFES